MVYGWPLKVSPLYSLGWGPLCVYTHCCTTQKKQSSMNKGRLLTKGSGGISKVVKVDWDKIRSSYKPENFIGSFRRVNMPGQASRFVIWSDTLFCFMLHCCNPYRGRSWIKFKTGFHTPFSGCWHRYVVSFIYLVGVDKGVENCQCQHWHIYY